MKISGFTIVKNAVKLHYPVVESIRSILPICDEFIVNVGDSQDGTLDLIKSIKNPKIRIIQTVWDMKKGPTVLSEQTNIALKECKGDWAFYLQTDEVIHESDLLRLKQCMHKSLGDRTVDALRFKWLHFYGSYWRYRIDAGWYQKQNRIIRNNGTIESYGDAYGFRRLDGNPLRSKPTGVLLYHYGWVNSNEAMQKRYDNASAIGYMNKKMSISITGDYGDLNRFPSYWGTHPDVVKEAVQQHQLSREDFDLIRRKLWWNPIFWLRPRFKTWRRVKERIT